jgi:hypothetical protein
MARLCWSTGTATLDDLTSLEDSTVEPELREVSKKACGVTV